VAQQGRSLRTSYFFQSNSRKEDSKLRFGGAFSFPFEKYGFFHILLPLFKNISMKFQLDNIITEYEALEAELADPSIYNDIKRLKTTNHKKKNLEKTVDLYREYK
jgi:hypothetical protein